MRRATTGRLAGFLVLLALLGALSVTPVAMAAPALSVTPPTGAPGTTFIIRGTGLTRLSGTGGNYGFQIAKADTGQVVLDSLAMVTGGGDLEVRLETCASGAQCRGLMAFLSPGAYLVKVFDVPPKPGDRQQVRTLVAQAQLGVTDTPPPAPPADALCFPGFTTFCIRGAFRQQWEAHGGLAINGYPLSDEFAQTLEDGKSYRVQYFERVRMEYHPEQADPQYQILLGQFGRRILKVDLGREADPPVPAAGPGYDPVTGHTIDPRFLAYYQTRGDLAQFGRPLTETFKQRLEDGQEYDVQYFERARFEWHPEVADAEYRVLLGQFGRRVLAEGER